jgi:excisionase family DNA binding protein
MSEQTERDLTFALSIKEASAFSGLGRSTLYRHMDDGELAFVKAGGRRLILKDDLKSFLTSRRQSA